MWEGLQEGGARGHTCGRVMLMHGKSHHHLVNTPQLKIKHNLKKKKRGDEDTDTQREGCVKT